MAFGDNVSRRSLFGPDPLIFYGPCREFVSGGPFSICWPNVKLFLELFPSSCFLCQQPATFYCYRVSQLFFRTVAVPVPCNLPWFRAACSQTRLGLQSLLLLLPWSGSPGGGRVWCVKPQHAQSNPVSVVIGGLHEEVVCGFW